MEMKLFAFKCSVLAPGLLYLCLIQVHRQNRTPHIEAVPSDMDPLNYNHSLQTQRGSTAVNHRGSVHRQGAFDLFQESPSSFPVQMA